MQIRNFVSSPHIQVAPESVLQLYSAPKADREPIKIIVIGSKAGVNTIVHTLCQRRFAEVFEWTDFLNAPGKGEALTLQTHEVMKVLIKYLPVL